MRDAESHQWFGLVGWFGFFFQKTALFWISVSLFFLVLRQAQLERGKRLAEIQAPLPGTD